MSSPMLEVTSSGQALERLSIGQAIQDTWITGRLDLDSLAASRWLCGEDMCGIYQPIVMQHCILDNLDLEGRTFYETVELVDCRIIAARFKHAYFYANLLIEDCIFKGDFEAQGIQSDGLIVVHNTVFAGYADFSGLNLRSQVDLLDVSFPGGTNLLHELANTNGSRGRLGEEITLNGCRFCAADVPTGLKMARLGIAPMVECDLA